jgi:hypothetical protein
MVYHAAGSAMRAAATHPVPLKNLVEFSRVTLAPSAEVSVNFELTETAFSLTDDAGDKTLYKGERTIIISRGNGVDVVLSVTL